MKTVKRPVGRPKKVKETKSELTIEKNIPIPGKFSSYPMSIYPFKKMKIGDSFYFEGLHRSTVYHYATYFAKRNGLPWKFATRQEKKGHRIWRIK